jgi:hypothetical protein
MPLWVRALLLTTTICLYWLASFKLDVDKVALLDFLTTMGHEAHACINWSSSPQRACDIWTGDTCSTNNSHV